MTLKELRKLDFYVIKSFYDLEADGALRTKGDKYNVKNVTKKRITELLDKGFIDYKKEWEHG